MKPIYCSSPAVLPCICHLNGIHTFLRKNTKYIPPNLHEYEFSKNLIWLQETKNMYEQLQAAKRGVCPHNMRQFFDCKEILPHQNALWKWKPQETLSSDGPLDHCNSSGHMQTTGPSSPPPPLFFTHTTSNINHYYGMWFIQAPKQAKLKQKCRCYQTLYEGGFYNSQLQQNPLSLECN